MKIHVEIYLAAQMLQRERGTFSTSELVERVRKKFGDERLGVQTHAAAHCVAPCACLLVVSCPRYPVPLSAAHGPQDMRSSSHPLVVYSGSSGIRPLGEPGSSNSSVCPCPSAVIAHMPQAPSRSDKKAMVLPSGDQAGRPSLASLSVSLTIPDPSVLMR